MQNFALLLFLVVFANTACQENTTELKEEKKETITFEEDKMGVNKYEKFYKNGKIKIQGILSNQKRIGKWVAFYEDGKKQSESNYKEGKRHGSCFSWFPNGSLRYVGQYDFEKPSGKWLFYDEYGTFVKEQNYSSSE